MVALLAGLALLVAAGPAAAKARPCARQVVADWFDNGRIDRLYPLNCYEEAIDLIPRDIRDYANAEEVITRALQGALRGKLVPGGPDPSPDDAEPEPGIRPAPGRSKSPQGRSGTPEAAPPVVDTSGPSSVPVPLLVLGGMSLALLAAGGLGYVARRRQGGDEDTPEPGA